MQFLLLGLVYRGLKAWSFDPIFSKQAGLPLSGIRWIWYALIVLAILAGVQAVGVVMMAAMLVSPALAARFWTQRLDIMLGVSAGVAMLASLLGTAISMQQKAMPTGPWIVVVLMILALLSVALAPERGWLAAWIRKSRIRKQMRDENILKVFYHLGEEKADFLAPRLLDELQEKRPIRSGDYQKGLQSLVSQDHLITSGKTWSLTAQGLNLARRQVRLHRLWEIYLSKEMGLAEDHLHWSAEAIEHVITPALEAELEAALSFPQIDPHGKPVARDKQREAG